MTVDRSPAARALSFAGIYLVAVIICGFLGDCFGGGSPAYYAFYAFIGFPLGIARLLGLNAWPIAGHVVYLVHFFWGMFTHSAAIYRGLLLSFTALLAVNMGSCVAQGGCFRGF